MKEPINICWFRRDLRLKDNAALYHSLKAGLPVLPIFIFDTNILDRLENKADRRLQFIHDAIAEMQAALKKKGSSMQVLHGTPEAVFKMLLTRYNIQTVFLNHDYEPYARERDNTVYTLLKERNVGMQHFKDQVIFEKDEVIKDDGTPYTVFTPYSKKWKAKVKDFYFKAYPTQKYFKHFIQLKPLPIPSLKQMGFEETERNFPSKTAEDALVKHYSETRDFPGIKGTSGLGIHLRFGTISIRALATKAASLSGSFLNELIWRDFYHAIAWHFPHAGRGLAFKPAYDKIVWRNNEAEFEKWCRGQTGYPIVDAGMRELNETGFMHNRVRMIVAGFLCKHLLVDWRWGEAYFAEKLLDYDLAANNGGWQWAAGSGCDAAPYFRIFNPYLQTKKFDPEFKYIRKWVPEFEELTYPQPIVNHEMARERCLKTYSKALKEN
jgi:deoxyribodipyrimidine photo-lyase